MKAHIHTNLDEACEHLAQEKLVAIPTETVYGLAADIFSDTAVRKIFSYKGRPEFNPLIVHIGQIEQVHQVAKEWPASANQLAQNFWPGPLTIVVPKNKEVSPLITAGLNTVGLRMPNHSLSLDLLKKYAKPLAAPSANKSTKTSPTTAQHVLNEFPEKELLILDGGDCNIGIESTVIGIDETSEKVQVTVYRLGAITPEQIKECFNHSPKTVSVKVKGHAASPGQMKEHYRPGVPLVIIPEDMQAPQVLQKIQGQLQAKTTVQLKLDDDAIKAARCLFTQLREAAASGKDVILIKRKKSQTGSYWNAIWDRLNRAATLDLSSPTI